MIDLHLTLSNLPDITFSFIGFGVSIATCVTRGVSWNFEKNNFRGRCFYVLAIVTGLIATRSIFSSWMKANDMLEGYYLTGEIFIFVLGLTAGLLFGYQHAHNELFVKDCQRRFLEEFPEDEEDEEFT